jgi:hypothetical protein
MKAKQALRELNKQTWKEVQVKDKHLSAGAVLNTELQAVQAALDAAHKELNQAKEANVVQQAQIERGDHVLPMHSRRAFTYASAIPSPQGSKQMRRWTRR